MTVVHFISTLQRIINRQWNANRGQSDLKSTTNPIFNKSPVQANLNLGYCKNYFHATDYTASLPIVIKPVILIA